MDTRIAGCAVTPAPDDIRGEEVFAFIVPADAKAADTDTLAASIVTTCAERLAYHKVPGYVAFVDELPLSSTRKLARGEIKILAAKAVARQTRDRHARTQGEAAPRLSHARVCSSAANESVQPYPAGTSASTRSGLPEPFWILSGAAMITAPVGGS